MRKLLLALVLPFASCASPSSAWRSVVAERVPEFGHRNWICIVDSAYPKQSRASIETVVTHADQLDVVRDLLRELDRAPHVRAEIVLDAELSAVGESDAHGISAYRDELATLLAGRKVERRSHEDILHELDAAGVLVDVLVLKTDLALPYTSVFLRLECGYWNAASESRLREALRASSASVR